MSEKTHEEQLGRITSTLVAMTQTLQEIKEQVDSVQRTLRGSNGDVGLVGRVQFLEREVTEQGNGLERLSENCDNAECDTRLKLLEKDKTLSWYWKNKPRKLIEYAILVFLVLRMLIKEMSIDLTSFSF